ncbi:hypothetical protein V7170_22995, partial [Priestia megaterium]|uniref:hypothetical protein n=1 Tax=Priestia megaterium TaxID=1404 RepID=UPI00300B62A3
AVDFRPSLSFLPVLTSCFAFPAGVFALPTNQQLEATTYVKPTFTLTIKKSEQVGFTIKNQTRSDLPSTNFVTASFNSFSLFVTLATLL